MRRTSKSGERSSSGLSWHPARNLESLYRSASGRPGVTYTFLALCLAVTLATILDPELYRVFGGVAPRRHWWQPFTAVFEHGWPHFHGSIHLALNLFLILEAGRPCERLLGSARFLLLTLLATAANAITISLTQGVNGSSLVIWAWGPPLFLAMRHAKLRNPDVTRTEAYRRIVRVLVIMYAVVIPAMAVLPYLAGWRGNPLVSLVRANLFHLVATAVGAAVALFFAGAIERRVGG